MRRRSVLMVASALALAIATAAQAHQLNVFASTDCEHVVIEAKFSSGRVPVTGAVRVLNGENAALLEAALGKDGMLRVPLAELDTSTGLLIEVDTGGHDDYWIMTSEDIAKQCQS